MGNVIYSMSVSLDGFIAGPGGDIGWSAPDEELHQFHNDRVRRLAVHLCGRRLYETMLYWETAGEDPSIGPVEREFEDIWQRLPKIVVSSTLDTVVGNWTLARDIVPEEIEKLKQQPGGDIGVGGAGLASTFARLGLIDEYQLFVNPVVLGAGTPFFPPLEQRIDLELVETRTFGSRIVYLCYRRA